MWTNENRARYERSGLRYPSDVTDAEWALIGPVIPPAKCGGGKRKVDMREVVNGLMYVLSTGCQWRAIPKDLPPKSTVYGYFDLWTYEGSCLDGAPCQGSLCGYANISGAVMSTACLCERDRPLALMVDPPGSLPQSSQRVRIDADP